MSFCLNDPKDVEERLARIKKLLTSKRATCIKCGDLLDDFQDVCFCGAKV